MTEPDEPLIDPELIAEQLGDLPADLREAIAGAFAADLDRCVGQLLDACSVGDSGGAGRARHALRGISGNFGATPLIRAAEGDLTHETDRARVRTLAARTLDAVGTVLAKMVDQ